MTDIAPELKERVFKRLKELLDQSDVIKTQTAKLSSSTVRYPDAYAYAQEVSQIVSRALLEVLTTTELPNGMLYLNISERIVPDILKEVHALIDNYCSSVTTTVNRASNLSIKAQPTEFQEDKATDLARKVADDLFDTQKWVLEDPVVTNALSVVDDHIRKQADFHSKAGLKPQISRVSTGKCCDWCDGLAGRYDYPDKAPKEVFQRHRHCRCKVEYWPGSGKRQDVWSKTWK